SLRHRGIRFEPFFSLPFARWFSQRLALGDLVDWHSVDCRRALPRRATHDGAGPAARFRSLSDELVAALLDYRAGAVHDRVVPATPVRQTRIADFRYKSAIAFLIHQLLASNAFRARSGSTAVSATTIRTARSRSFAFAGCRSIIRLLRTLPIRTMASVVNRFKRSFVAVPAFSRVDPVSNSGPRSGATTTLGRNRFGISRYGLKHSRMVVAPRRLASRKA